MKDVSFSADAGEFVALVGPNGSGKTTMLQMACGRIVPDGGDILLYDKNVRAYGVKELAKKAAYVDQSLDGAFQFKVFELVLMGRWAHLNGRLMENKEDLHAAQEALVKTQCISFAGRDYFELSAGEKQKVLLSLALAQQTPVLLVDEPTSHLDLKNQIEILTLLKQLSREGKTVVAAIHDINLVLAFATKVILLKQGTMKSAGAPCDVLTKENLEDVFDVKVTTVYENNKPYILLNHEQ